jgi:primosomal protein N' (replication factor Y) (superfamily II helicase)
VDRIARVEPLTTARALRGPFDYRVDGLDAPVGVGTRLQVPFAGRTVTAVVTGTAASSDVPEAKLAAP